MECIIVEDNVQDLELLRHYVSQERGLTLKQCFSNGVEALSYLMSFRPPLLFLDIDMPGLKGIDLFKQLPYRPICVFVTAHGEYALDSYESQAFDFILKPVMPDRLARTVQRIQEYTDICQRADLYDTVFEAQCIMIKEGTSLYKVPLQEIIYLEALNDYTKVVTKTRKYTTLSKLRHFLDKLPPKEFIRIHRTYAVALKAINKATSHELHISGLPASIELPIGKTYRQDLKVILAAF